LRGTLLPLSLFCAVAATCGLAVLALLDRPEPPGEDTKAGPADEEAPAPPPRPVRAELRPYQTTLTLTEDLRDALAGDPVFLEREVWRVSEALASKARWTLKNLALVEASPKLRALEVLAAGVHVPEDPLVLGFLSDRETIVRRAAVLAIGYAPDGKERASLLGAEVPLGRTASPEVQRMLELCEGKEKAAEVRLAISSVLSSRR
jgi:hypothetical protein